MDLALSDRFEHGDWSSTQKSSHYIGTGRVPGIWMHGVASAVLSRS